MFRHSAILTPTNLFRFISHNKNIQNIFRPIKSYFTVKKTKQQQKKLKCMKKNLILFLKICVLSVFDVEQVKQVLKLIPIKN